MMALATRPLASTCGCSSSIRTRPHRALASRSAPRHPIRQVAGGTRRSCVLVTNAVGIFYSTSSGNTEEVANMIKEQFGDAAQGPMDIGDMSDLESLKGYDALVVGAPTWNTGADEDRSGTAWDNKLGSIKKLDLSGKPVACFGLGDSSNYGDYYCDAIEEVHTGFAATGAKMIGFWPSAGYQHSESKAETEEGWFCGLALDQDNEDDLTPERVQKWVAQVKGEIGM